MKKLLMLVAIILLFNSGYQVAGQTKSETKQYNSAIKKGTIKAYDKFLKKYKSSIYYPNILYKRDSIVYNSLNLNDVISVMQFIENNPDSPFVNDANLLIDKLNTSQLTQDEATSILKAIIPLAADAPSPHIKALGYRQLNTDYIIGISLGEADCPIAQYKVYTLRQDGENWLKDTVLLRAKYIFSEKMGGSSFADTLRFVTIDGRKLLNFSYINKSRDTKHLEYVTNLLEVESGNVYSATFYGNNITPTEGSKADTLQTEYAIEGQSPDAMSGGLISQEVAFLLNTISSNNALMQISEENALTDEAIQWWYNKNPKAASSARSLSFGIITKESGIVQKYIASQGKERSRTYNASLFDIRGNTVICAYSKGSKEFMLVWCEPIAINKKKDKLLNTIYFEKDNTLVLFYYKGNTTFKIRVNLATKVVTR